MKWFGKSWGAPVCEYVEHVATPVDELCLPCGRPIASGDRGFIIPLTERVTVKPDDTIAFKTSDKPWHLDCFRRNLGILPDGEKKMSNTMTILNSGGDTKIMWNRDNRDEVSAAREHFKSLRKQHYLAFRAEGREGTRGSQIDDFDPELERIIMVPRSVGG